MHWKTEIVIKYFTISVFQPGNIKLIYLTNFTENSVMFVCFEANNISLSVSSLIVLCRAAFFRKSREDSTANLEGHSCATLFTVSSSQSLSSSSGSARCVWNCYRIWRMILHFSFRACLLAFFSQQTSFSITTESNQSSMNAAHSKKNSHFSFKPCALNYSYCKIHILR